MKLKSSVIILSALLSAFSTTQAKVRVTTTTTDLASLVRMVGGGDLVDVFSLSRPLQDPHYLDATPGMIVRISRSDLFVKNGLELEMGWIPEVLRETRNRSVRPGGPGHVDASQGIQAIQIPERILRDMGDVHPSGNPHYTLEPVISQQAARNIAEGLIRVDSKNAETYRKNLETYIDRSNQVVEAWKEKFAPYSGAGIIIYHKHFDYMLKSLGLNILDAIEPLPGIAPSARHLGRIISQYTPETARVVIMEPWHDIRVGRQAAEGIGVPLVIGCPAVGACEEASDLITLFETNARKLLEALRATSGK